VAEEALDIDLPGLLLNRPGSERVTESVRVHFRDPALFTQSLENRPHRAAVQVTAAASSQKQVTWSVSPERADVVFQRLSRTFAEADYALLVALGVLDQHSLGGEVHVPQLQVGELACPKARVQEHQDQGLVASPLPGAGVTVAEEQLYIVRRERLNYLLRNLDVLDLSERVAGDVVVADEPGEEGAGLPLPSPLGHGGHTSVGYAA